MKETPTLLLVHGSWHGPWCWDHLLPELDRLGIFAVTVDLPSCGTDPAALKGMPEDAALVARTAAGIDGDVVVVGHSYGGAVVSEARFGGNVRRLIFLGAFMPDSGRLYTSYLPPGPLPAYVGIRDDGTFAVPPGQAIDTFYADCAPEIGRWAESKLRLQSQAVLGHPIGHASWRDIPSIYIVLKQDRALPPEMERMFGAQASEMIEFDSSHSPFLSRPADLAALLAEMANAGALQIAR